MLFTVKAVKNKEVLAPHSRNYFESVRDVVALDSHTVRFDLRKPYFLNQQVLGSIQPLPRHYYDPDDLMGISASRSSTASFRWTPARRSAC